MFRSAPLGASSGDQQRHRLSRTGNRRVNQVLHIMAVATTGVATPGSASRSYPYLALALSP
ncbi:MAG TPA: transposase [Pseudonocardiaceae bacterium]|nr:transposase [Pseudonocardiaceae bacterium]